MNKKTSLHRKDLIKDLVLKRKFKSYLELGLKDKQSVFNHIPCEHKFSVDINMESATYNMSTDDFFLKLKNNDLNIPKDYQWDVIFIDANHLADFVFQDLINSVSHLKDNGIIFLHDVLPPNYSMQLETRGCQTAWKVIPHLLKFNPELHICSIDEIHGGLGIVTKNKLEDRKVLDKNFNRFSEYYIMDKDRLTSQNKIEYNELDTWLKNPTYNFQNQSVEDRVNMYKTHFS